VDLPEGVAEVAGVILSGDEVLIYPVYCDPMEYERMMDFFDGVFRKQWNGEAWVDMDIQEIHIDIEK